MSGDAVVIGAIALMVIGAILNSWLPIIGAVVWFVVGLKDQ